MAGNDVALFTPGAVPAHVAGFLSTESNIQDRQTVPSLSPEGKMWTIGLDGTKTKLLRKNADGDEEPVSVMRVVILDYNQRRGRAYYEGEYDPAKVSAPLCWSEDGIAPDPTSEKLQAQKCADCPMAVKGSKVTPQGKAVTACGQHRMLAVVPAFKLDFTPLRLKIAMTSDWDKQSPEAEQQGWFAFNNYTDWLKSRGVAHTAALVTKMKFDPNAPYPKIFFAADRWLEADEIAKVAPLTKSDSVQKLLGGFFTPAGIDGVAKSEPATAAEPEGNVAGAAEPASTAEPQAASLSPAPTADDDGDGEIIMAGLDAPAAEPVQAPAQAEESITLPETKPEPAKAAEKAEEVAPKVSTEVPADVADLLKEWS